MSCRELEMIRVFGLLVVVVGTGLFSANLRQSSNSPERQSDVDSLKEQRVKLLQERVSAIKSWIEEDLVGTSELIQAEMDVINAQLEYAETDADRKRLLSELLRKYEVLIEHAELLVQEPPRIGADDPARPMHAESELLHLKSERIRVRILFESIP